MERQEVRTAILDKLRELGADPSTSISLFDIGVPLVAGGYEQGDIVDALFALESEGVLSLVKGNRLQLRKAI